MALKIEDGTVVMGAQSYASYDELVTYGRLRDVTVTTVQADGEVLLLNAMDALKDRRWKGEPVTTTQSLAWPRTGVYVDNQLRASNEIPRELFYGQLALAVESIDGGKWINLGWVSAKSSSSNPGGIEIRADSSSIAKIVNNDDTVMQVSAFANADALLRVLERKSGLALVSSVPKWKVLKR